MPCVSNISSSVPPESQAGLLGLQNNKIIIEFRIVMGLHSASSAMINSGNIIAELKHSPITVPNSNNPSSRENLVVRQYDHTTIQGATFSMRGQLYHRHYLSHYEMDGRGRKVMRRRDCVHNLDTPLMCAKTPSHDDKVRILERRAAV